MAIGATISIGGGVIKGIKAKNAEEDAAGRAKTAQEELDKQKEAFKGLDTSNPYLNMENQAEDLTVNKQEAEFTQQQQMQSQANIMDQMRGSAGSSGVAGLAQTLANQGSLDAQKASASIGQQESKNQQLAAQEASNIQDKEREGEIISRQAEMGKISSLMGMSAQELAAFQGQEAQARQAGNDAIDMAGQGAAMLGQITPASEGGQAFWKKD
jgi:hypothetical protein